MPADLSTVTVVDAVMQAIRADISVGDYAPGTRLSEQDIADRFSVARPTAKAAIERLVEVGLLRRTANKTAEIPVLSSEDILDLYRFRRRH
jgi:DNA-binding GntR family transcriptional regulator